MGVVELGVESAQRHLVSLQGHENRNVAQAQGTPSSVPLAFAQVM